MKSPARRELLLIGCLLLAGCAKAPPKPVAVEPAPPPSREAEIVAIKEKVEVSEPLSDAEVETLLGLLLYDNKLDRQHAYGVAAKAYAAGLLETGPYLETCEKGAILTEGMETSNYLLACKTALGLGEKPSDKVLEQWEQIRNNRHQTSAFADPEVEFISSTLASNSMGNRLAAGRIFVVKRGLSKDALEWARKVLASEAEVSDGSEREYWLLVERIVVERNVG